MKIYRKTLGITVSLHRATDEDILAMEARYPDDNCLPTLGIQESWVLTIDKKPEKEAVGVVEYYLRDSELVITGLWIAPDYRGKGYGTMMIELIEATERPTILRVITTSQSLKFYEKRGFTPDIGYRVLTRVSSSPKEE